MQEMQVRSLSQEDPLEQEMTIHSSILAWEVPWTEEPGGLQFMRFQNSHTWLSDYTTITTTVPIICSKSLECQDLKLQYTCFFRKGITCLLLASPLSWLSCHCGFSLHSYPLMLVECPLAVVAVQLFPLLSSTLFSSLCQSIFNNLRLNINRRFCTKNEVFQKLQSNTSPWRQEEEKVKTSVQRYTDPHL